MRNVILSVALCVAGTALPAYAEAPVKVGMITTLSGPAGYLGQDIRDGFKLAMDMQGGKLGGAPVDLIVEDDNLKPGKGREIADHLLKDDKVKIFTGVVFSNVASATAPEITESGALFISPNAGPSTFAGKGCNKNYFVVSSQNDTMMEAAGQYATNLGFKKAFLLAPNYQGGKDSIVGFKRYFKGEIAGEVYTQLDQTDFAAEMSNIRAANPDVVFEFEPGGLGIAFLRQYRQAGLMGKIPLVVSEASMDHVILAAVGEQAVGMYVAAHWNPDLDNVANQAFTAAWTKAYNRPATVYSSQGYDTALAIASALKATDGNVADIAAFRGALAKADFQSVRGPFAFGPNQHPIQNWYALRVETDANGKPVLKTHGLIAAHQGDAYSADCKL